MPFFILSYFKLNLFFGQHIISTHCFSIRFPSTNRLNSKPIITNQVAYKTNLYESAPNTLPKNKCHQLAKNRFGQPFGFRFINYLSIPRFGYTLRAPRVMVFKHIVVSPRITKSNVHVCGYYRLSRQIAAGSMLHRFSIGLGMCLNQRKCNVSKTNTIRWLLRIFVTFELMYCVK